MKRNLWINGKEEVPAKGQYFISKNPATGLEWAEIAAGDEEDIDRAVGSARAAFAKWRKVEPAQRAALLYALSRRIDENKDELAVAESTDNGKAIRESSGEIAAAADYLRYYAGLADKVYGDSINTRRDTLMYTYREPYGVVGAITPWNSPFYMAVRKMAPALAAGNTVVLKPAEDTSVTALMLAKMTGDVGLPAGVFNVVTGIGSVAGVALTSHPDVDKLAFTGESATGVAITRSSAPNVTPLSFELGGKAAHIIFEDAQIELAAASAVNGAYGACGQSCTAGSRLFVHSKILDQFLEKYLQHVSVLRIGDPLDYATQVGCLTNEAQLDKVTSYMEVAKEEGCRRLLGGERLQTGDLKNGLFFEATVLDEVKPSMRVAREEIFGPVSMVMPFDDDEEVVKYANDTPYGLTSGMWTRDLSRAHRIARELDAGVVWVNTFRTVHQSLPYGGYKASGYGREDGIEGLLWYTHTKSVMIDLAPEDRPNLFELGPAAAR